MNKSNEIQYDRLDENITFSPLHGLYRATDPKCPGVQGLGLSPKKAWLDLLRAYALKVERKGEHQYELPAHSGLFGVR